MNKQHLKERLIETAIFIFLIILGIAVGQWIESISVLAAGLYFGVMYYFIWYLHNML